MEDRATAQPPVLHLSQAELREVEKKQRTLAATNQWSVRNRLKATLLRLPQPERRTRADLVDIAALASCACRFIAQHPVAQRIALCRVMTCKNYKKGAIIVTAGDQGTHFYILLTGSCAMEAGERISKGVGFGEMSLVTGKPQLFSIVAESNTDLLLIDKSTYLRVFQQDESNLAIILNFLLHEVRALRHIDRRMVESMAQWCSLMEFKSEHVFHPDEGATINFIVEGRCSLMAPRTESDPLKGEAARYGTIQRTAPLRSRYKHLAVLDKGAIFGESCLDLKLQKGWLIFADTQTKCVQITKSFFTMHENKQIVEAITAESLFHTAYITGRNNTTTAKALAQRQRPPSPSKRKPPKDSYADPEEITRDSYIGLFYTAPQPPPPWRVTNTGAVAVPVSTLGTSTPKTELTTQEKLDKYGLATCEGFPRRFPRLLPTTSAARKLASPGVGTLTYESNEPAEASPSRTDGAAKASPRPHAVETETDACCDENVGDGVVHWDRISKLGRQKLVKAETLGRRN